MQYIIAILFFGHLNHCFYRLFTQTDVRHYILHNSSHMVLIQTLVRKQQWEFKWKSLWNRNCERKMLSHKYSLILETYAGVTISYPLSIKQVLRRTSCEMQGETLKIWSVQTIKLKQSPIYAYFHFITTNLQKIKQQHFGILSLSANVLVLIVIVYLYTKFTNKKWSKV